MNLLSFLLKKKKKSSLAGTVNATAKKSFPDVTILVTNSSHAGTAVSCSK